MDVVILCGGKGSRLSLKTADTPKPLVEIGGYPILYHIMKYFYKSGFDRFHLALGYKGNDIKKWFMNDYPFIDSISVDFREALLFKGKENWSINFKNTGLESGTGYRLKQLKNDIDGPFILTYGDGLSDINLAELVAHHKRMVKEKGVVATVSANQPKSQFGIIKSKNGLVKEFVEKPILDDWTSIGFFVCEPSFFDYIPMNKPSCMFEVDVLPKLVEQGKMAVYEHPGFFKPMDTIKDYDDLNEMWNKNKAPWRIWK